MPRPIVGVDDYGTFLHSSSGTLPFGSAAVSGATGFVGSHLVGLLRQGGVTVRALVRGDRTPSHLAVDGVAIVRGDVRDPAAVRALVQGVDVIFHTAAVVTPWLRDPEEQYDVAVGGTKSLVEAAEELDVPVVCTGSIVVHNPYPPPWPVRLVDGNHYVRSKRIAQELVRYARRRGVRVSMVTPSGIIGPGDYRPSAIGRLVLDAMADKAPPLTFDGGIHLVDVRDVAEGLVRAALAEPDDHALPGELWMLDQLFGAAGARSRQRRVPYAAAFGGAALMTGWSRLVTGRAPQITPAWAHYFRQAPAIHYDDHGSRLGITARPIATAIADTVAWYE